MAVDFSKRFLKPGEVERVLQRTRAQVTRLAQAKRLKRVRHGGQWRYLTSEVRALAHEWGLFDEGKKGPGTTEATAIAMIRDGYTDGEIVERLSLSLDTVERLRLSLGLTATAAETRETLSRERERVEDDKRPSDAKQRLAQVRAKLAEQRAALHARIHRGGKGSP